MNENEREPMNSIDRAAWLVGTLAVVAFLILFVLFMNGG